MDTYARAALAAFSFATGLAAQQADLPPAPGKLVDVGGRRLHLICTGRGAPTVVLEAGASSFAIDWTLVQRGARQDDPRVFVRPCRHGMERRA